MKKLVRPRWTKEQVKTLRKMYANTPNADIAEVLNCSVSKVVFKAHRLGLHKSKARLRQMGIDNIDKRWSKPKRGRKNPKR
jgi:hypothetical protein